MIVIDTGIQHSDDRCPLCRGSHLRITDARARRRHLRRVSIQIPLIVCKRIRAQMLITVGTDIVYIIKIQCTFHQFLCRIFVRRQMYDVGILIFIIFRFPEIIDSFNLNMGIKGRRSLSGKRCKSHRIQRDDRLSRYVFTGNHFILCILQNLLCLFLSRFCCIIWLQACIYPS